jgi:hypothetical protein
VSNYVQSTNFATKDALTSGDPLKIVKGTEINTEFVNIAVAVATKADLASPTFTGTPTLPTGTIGVTQSPGNNSTLLSTTAYIDAAITAVKAALFPVGSIFTAVVATNPGTLLGFGTWTAFGAGRVPVGFDAGNVLFDTAEETGGAANATLPSHTHTATVTDPSHTHTVVVTVAGGGGVFGGTSVGAASNSNTTASAVTGITVANSTEGASATNANYQPYITVSMWKRDS